MPQLETPPQPPESRTSVRRILVLMIAVLLVGLLLGYSYQFCGYLVNASGWIPALFVHLLLSGIVLFHYWRTPSDPRIFRVKNNSESSWIKWLYLAPILVVGICAAAAFFTRVFLEGAQVRAVSHVQWAWILLVPVVEEITFRVGIGRFFRRYGGILAGAWFSAILFSWAHTQPTVGGLVEGGMGLPLGPFLLALCCEGMLYLGGRVYPLILLHAACNATVVVFSVIDARWLGWLGLLYGKS